MDIHFILNSEEKDWGNLYKESYLQVNLQVHLSMISHSWDVNYLAFLFLFKQKKNQCDLFIFQVMLMS